MYGDHVRHPCPASPAPPPTPATPTPVTPKTYPFLSHALSPMSGLHSILGKKANRSSSLSQVVNYFDSSPSMSDNSATVLDSPLRRPEHSLKQHSSFYNPRQASDSESDSDNDESLRDQSPELAEIDSRGLRLRRRSLMNYLGPKRWPDRLRGENSSGSSGIGTNGSNSTTSLSGQQDLGGSGRQNSPEFAGSNVARASVSDIGSEDIPITRLSVSRNETLETRTMSPFPKNLQRIAATLAEESRPTESEMRREGMLYRYLRDYTPASPMHSPLDAIPYDLDADDEIIDTQSWWNDQSTHQNSSCRRDSSPSLDPMDNFTLSTRGHSVPPMTLPEPPNRRPSTTSSINGGEGSPTIQGSMPPPMIPQLARMKRKATAEYGLDAAAVIKRRAVSPGSSPLLSPIAVNVVRERRVLNLQDTHNGLEKMSLQDQ